MNDTKAEQAVLGCLKEDPKLFDYLFIDSDYFTDSRFKTVFKIMRDMYDKGKEINDITFTDFLQKHGTPILPSVFIGIETRPTGNVKYYVDILKDIFILNKYQRLANEISDRIKQKDPAAMIEFVDKYITDMNTVNGKPIVSNQEFLVGQAGNLDERLKTKSNIILKTNISVFDTVIKGYDRGTLNIIAARPSIGKSAFMLNMAYEMARRYKVGIFSLEMTLEMLHDRVTALNSGVDLHNIKSGELLQREFKLCHDGLSKVYDRQLWLDDTAYIRFGELKAKIRQMIRYGVEIVFIDYLTLIKYNLKGIPRFERVGMLCKELKKIAAENKLAIVVLSQLNRNAEDKQPSLADLRMSGEVEEDADSITLLHRDRSSDDLFIYVAKNRNGPTGDTHIIFERSTGRFLDA